MCNGAFLPRYFLCGLRGKVVHAFVVYNRRCAPIYYASRIRAENRRLSCRYLLYSLRNGHPYAAIHAAYGALHLHAVRYYVILAAAVYAAYCNNYRRARIELARIYSLKRCYYMRRGIYRIRSLFRR